MDNAMFEWLIPIAAVSTALLIIGTLVTKVWKEVSESWTKLKEVLESYLGRPATKYYDAEPSIPERMKSSEDLLVKLNIQGEINEQRLFLIEKHLFTDKK